MTEFVVGDAVSVVPAFSFADYGLYGELVNAPAHAVVKHPDNLSFIEAAATWMMFITAYGALIEFGKLEAAGIAGSWRDARHRNATQRKSRT